MHIRLIFYCLLFLITNNAFSQDIDQLLNEATHYSTDYTTATFKSTRIINGHSIERMQEGQLDVRFSHRFGTINEGSYTLWGLDEANVHFSGEYGITNWLMAGIGRGTYEKTYDGFLKFSWLRQSTGDIEMPVSVSFLLASSVNTLLPADMGLKGETVYVGDRFSYIYQLLVARKFSESFSFEINPTVVHRNIVATALDPNDMFAVGFGGRIKLSKRVSFNGEWYHVFPPLRNYKSVPNYDPIAIGFDIETGGHVFQIFKLNNN